MFLKIQKNAGCPSRQPPLLSLLSGEYHTTTTIYHTDYEVPKYNRAVEYKLDANKTDPILDTTYNDTEGSMINNKQPARRVGIFIEFFIELESIVKQTSGQLASDTHQVLVRVQQ